ncbi:MAG TPA: hypothetical protein VG935_02855, partial [Patescibacteria group bacterium]|nr:hypothetical protein [Patescibacteria group bacterium]
NIAKEKAANGETEITVKPHAKTDPADVSVLHYAATGDHSPEWMDTLWKNMIMEIKNHNHMIAGVLRSCRLVAFDRKTLVIEAVATFHKERLEEPKTFEALLTVCEQLIGNPVEITIQLKQ